MANLFSTALSSLFTRPPIQKTLGDFEPDTLVYEPTEHQWEKKLKNRITNGSVSPLAVMDRMLKVFIWRYLNRAVFTKTKIMIYIFYGRLMSSTRRELFINTSIYLNIRFSRRWRMWQWSPMNVILFTMMRRCSTTDSSQSRASTPSWTWHQKQCTTTSPGHPTSPDSTCWSWAINSASCLPNASAICSTIMTSCKYGHMFRILRLINII